MKWDVHRKRWQEKAGGMRGLLWWVGLEHGRVSCWDYVFELNDDRLDSILFFEMSQTLVGFQLMVLQKCNLFSQIDLFPEKLSKGFFRKSYSQKHLLLPIHLKNSSIKSLKLKLLKSKNLFLENTWRLLFLITCFVMTKFLKYNSFTSCLH